MTRPARVMLRDVESSDLEVFYTQQLDSEAIRMAAFVSADSTDKGAFASHWAKILRAPRNTNRTIVADGEIAGYIACFPLEERLEVTYSLGREFWGRGIATRALQEMLRLVAARPIFARAATDNLGSLGVLQKCGFRIVGSDRGFAHGRGKETEEYVLRLDVEVRRPPGESRR